ncbi:MAG: cyclic nucleotide-binding domain-containing protein [Gammaproteobacteria bacterium]|nr:cyclic nucleotide-binding domain-containing protein [Gammaproteobacteria bacterium]
MRPYDCAMLNTSRDLSAREVEFLPFDLGKINSAKLNTLLKHQQLLHKGQHLYRMDEPCHALFIVRSGSIKTYTPTNNGDEKVQGFHLPKDLIGLEALSEERYSISAVALTMSTVYKLPIKSLEEIYKKNPRLGNKLHKLIGKVIDNNYRMFTLIGKKNSGVRVATMLLNLSSQYHELGYSATELCLTMTRKDIGNYLGLAEETVSRIFTQFHHLGILTADKKQLVIHDVKALNLVATGKST